MQAPASGPVPTIFEVSPGVFVYVEDGVPKPLTACPHLHNGSFVVYEMSDGRRVERSTSAPFSNWHWADLLVVLLFSHCFQGRH